MNCHIRPLSALSDTEVAWVRQLTKPGSDFANSLRAGKRPGTIAVCYSGQNMAGWVRTDFWDGHQTLEGYVSEPMRRAGVATFCAAGLVASGVLETGEVATFDAQMTRIATRLGLVATQFRRDGERWVLA